MLAVANWKDCTVQHSERRIARCARGTRLRLITRGRERESLFNARASAASCAPLAYGSYAGVSMGAESAYLAVQWVALIEKGSVGRATRLFSASEGLSVNGVIETFIRSVFDYLYSVFCFFRKSEGACSDRREVWGTRTLCAEGCRGQLEEAMEAERRLSRAAREGLPGRLRCRPLCCAGGSISRALRELV